MRFRFGDFLKDNRSLMSELYAIAFQNRFEAIHSPLEFNGCGGRNRHHNMFLYKNIFLFNYFVKFLYRQTAQPPCVCPAEKRSFVYGMTVVAAHIIPCMPPCFPESEMPVSGMTAHTSLRLLSCGNRSFVETNRVRLPGRLAHMLWIESMAGSTGLPAAEWSSILALYSMFCF